MDKEVELYLMLLIKRLKVTDSRCPDLDNHRQVVQEEVNTPTITNNPQFL